MLNWEKERFRPPEAYGRSLLSLATEQYRFSTRHKERIELHSNPKGSLQWTSVCVAICRLVSWTMFTEDTPLLRAWNNPRRT